MTNWNLINAAVQLVVDYNEFCGRVETNENIQQRVLEWYNHTDITDVEMLAAAALSGNYSSCVKYEALVAAKELYFPSEPIELGYHVNEYEKSYSDYLWH